jgi:hypothetical protein
MVSDINGDGSPDLIVAQNDLGTGHVTFMLGN